MNSLKSIIPLLSDILGLSEHALYERQRALVRAGLLKATEGRGPGSGVKATPEAVAMLIISVLATDNLSDVALMTAALARAVRVDIASENAMPEVRTFKAAIVRCLSSDDEKDGISVARVYRLDQQASVWLFDHKQIHFGKMPGSRVITVMAQASAGAFSELRRLLKRMEPPSR